MHRLRPTFLSSSRPFLRNTYRHYSSDSPRVINITDIPAPHNGRIRILSLNRPSARNAISSKLLHELRYHINSISSEYGSDGSEIPPPANYGGAAGVDKKGPTRALVITSEVDSCFCAGADLKERAGFTPEEYGSPDTFCRCLSHFETNIWPLKNHCLPLQLTKHIHGIISTTNPDDKRRVLGSSGRRPGTRPLHPHARLRFHSRSWSSRDTVGHNSRRGGDL
jgi:hypothetical protein